MATRANEPPTGRDRRSGPSVFRIIGRSTWSMMRGAGAQCLVSPRPAQHGVGPGGAAGGLVFGSRSARHRLEEALVRVGHPAPRELLAGALGRRRAQSLAFG